MATMTKPDVKPNKAGKGRSRFCQGQAGDKEKMRIGAALANQLVPLMGASECAKKLGISTQYLRTVECMALYKVQCRLRELKDDFDNA